MKHFQNWGIPFITAFVLGVVDIRITQWQWWLLAVYIAAVSHINRTYGWGES